jgi:hypothetical protein
LFIRNAGVNGVKSIIGRAQRVVSSRGTTGSITHASSRIFHEAGLEASWIWCPVPLTTDSDPACAAEVGLQDLRVRIVDHPQGNYLGGDIFGFSIAPAIATVYYGRALSVGNSDEAKYEVPVILGCAMAHEIGHLLLGPRAHTLTGIMQPQWKRTHLEQAMKGRLLFTADQALRMRCKAASRLAPAPGGCENEFHTTLDWHRDTRWTWSPCGRQTVNWK